MENDIIRGMIYAMNKMGADSTRSMFDVKIDGEKYWVHIDIVKEKEKEDEEPKCN